MRNFLLVILAVFSISTFNAQEDFVFDTLDINDVVAPVYAGGPYFMNPFNAAADYAVNSDIKVIYACSPWVAGLDDDDNLHVSAETFRMPCNPQGDIPAGIDYWSGPKANTYDELYDSRFYKIWKIDQSEIDYHLNNYANAGYEAPDDFLTWPGNGDVSNGEPEQLAPYYDMNNNGLYEPLEGDAPMIKGDQALYMITTDAREENTFSDGEVLGIDIHFTFYTIACPAYEIPQVNETTFINMRVVNRSNNNYHDLYVGNWTDFDIGTANNDYLGTAPEQNLQYAYNASQLDLPSMSSQGFGLNSAACGLMYLNHSLAHSMTYNNGASLISGEPTEPIHYYNYIRTLYKDGTPFIDQDGNNTNYIFSDSPTNDNGWSELTENNPGADRRGIASIGPVNLNGSEEIDVDFAIIYARGEYDNDSLGHLLNVDQLIDNAEQIQLYYDGQTSCSTIETDNIEGSYLSVYPNPSIGVINVTSTIPGVLDIYNLRGQLVHSENVVGNRTTVDVSEFASGLYFIRQGGETIQFVKE